MDQDRRREHSLASIRNETMNGMGRSVDGGHWSMGPPSPNTRKRRRATDSGGGIDGLPPGPPLAHQHSPASHQTYPHQSLQPIQSDSYIGASYPSTSLPITQSPLFRPGTGVHPHGGVGGGDMANSQGPGESTGGHNHLVKPGSFSSIATPPTQYTPNPPPPFLGSAAPAYRYSTGGPSSGSGMITTRPSEPFFPARYQNSNLTMAQPYPSFQQRMGDRSLAPLLDSSSSTQFPPPPPPQSTSLSMPPPTPHTPGYGLPNTNTPAYQPTGLPGSSSTYSDGSQFQEPPGSGPISAQGQSHPDGAPWRGTGPDQGAYDRAYSDEAESISGSQQHMRFDHLSRSAPPIQYFVDARGIDKEGVKISDEEKKARRKEQNRLAQQDLRRRRMEHAQFLESRVGELTTLLETERSRVSMLESLCQKLQGENYSLRLAVSGGTLPPPETPLPPPGSDTTYAQPLMTSIPPPPPFTTQRFQLPTRPAPLQSQSSSGSGQSSQLPSTLISPVSLPPNDGGGQPLDFPLVDRGFGIHRFPPGSTIPSATASLFPIPSLQPTNIFPLPSYQPQPGGGAMISTVQENRLRSFKDIIIPEESGSTGLLQTPMTAAIKVEEDRA